MNGAAEIVHLSLGVHELAPELVEARVVQGREAVSRPFRFDVTITTPLAPAVFERAALGRRAELSWTVQGFTREVRGVITSVRHEGPRNRAEGAVHQSRVRLEPRLSLLRHRKGSRVLRAMRVDQVIADALAFVGVRARFELAEAPPVRDYTTQYDETDLAFVERLAAENGLLYYFDDPAPALDEEVVIFCDHPKYPPIAGGGATGVTTMPILGFDTAGAVGNGAEAVTEFHPTRRVRPTRVVYRDFDPARPLAVIETSADAAQLEKARTAGFQLDPALELYEHGDTHLFPDWVRASTDPERALRASRREAWSARGRSSSPRLAAGRCFELDAYPDGEIERAWAVTSVEHELHATNTEGVSACANAFRCVPASVAFVPKRPPRRCIQVCLTATVVGAPGEEVHVNEHGEIRVHFHWDRDPRGERSSAWIRTMHPWAGAGWGAQFIPRVGMEVVVGFEYGDPDRPLVLGAVYNAILPPPFALPKEKTRSGLRTRSTPGGSGYNELSFEDAEGREQVLLRAQRDLDEVVLHDRRARIGHDDRVEVSGDASAEIAGAARTRVTKEREAHVLGDDRLRVEGARTVSVAGTLSERIEGDRVVRVDAIDRREVVGETRLLAHADVIADVRGGAAVLIGRPEDKRSCAVLVEGVTQLTGTGTVEMVSEAEIVLRCGESAIRIGPKDIEIESPKVTVRGEKARLLLESGEAKLKVERSAQIVSDDTIVFKSAGASIGLKSEAHVAGARVLLNSPENANDKIEIAERRVTRVELVDANGGALPFERFRVTDTDGATVTGFLDAQGRAEVLVTKAADIVFPDLGEVERKP